MKPNYHVLLIDESESDHARVRGVLESASLTVRIEVARTVEEALVRLEGARFDFVIFEVGRGDRRGFELLERARCDGVVLPPVFALAQEDDEESGIEALRLGVEDYFVRERTDPESMRHAIRHALERHPRRAHTERRNRDLLHSNEMLASENERLSRLASTDALTGIGNQRAFQVRLAQLLAEASRGRRFAMVFVDIDHFKAFNDDFGHSCGDKVLCEVARVLCDTVREVDFVARYGGEEFAILLVDVRRSEALALAERLRQAVEAIERFPRRISISIGVRVARSIDHSPIRLVQEADLALYSAKRTGRNRIGEFPQPPDPPPDRPDRLSGAAVGQPRGGSPPDGTDPRPEGPSLEGLGVKSLALPILEMLTEVAGGVAHAASKRTTPFFCQGPEDVRRFRDACPLAPFLEECHGMFQSFFASYPEAAIVLDRAGIVVLWNRVAERLLGWTGEEAIGKPCPVDPVAPDRTPVLARALAGERVESMEVRFETKVGSRVEATLSATPVHGASGDPERFLLVLCDLAPYRILVERRARRLLERCLDAYVRLDATGRIVEWNPRAEAVLGRVRDEMLGEEFAPLILPDPVRTAFRTGLEQAVLGESVDFLGTRFETVALTPDGGRIPVEIMAWSDGIGDSTTFHAFLTDLRDRKLAQESAEAARQELRRAQDDLENRVAKRTEELTQANRDLETVLHILSHDLVEPLRAIEGFSALLREHMADRLDERARDYLGRIDRATIRLRRQLGDILTLARARRIERVSECTAGSAIVGEAIARLETRIRETGATLRVAEDLPSFSVDKTWAVEAVYNLLSNSLKFTRAGSPPDIDVAPYRTGRREPVEVGLEIRDRGPGVPPGHEDRIFGLFQRAVGREVEGTGTGLAIVREVAQRHGGRAWVRPREGGGSVFIITFRDPSLVSRDDVATNEEGRPSRERER